MDKGLPHKKHNQNQNQTGEGKRNNNNSKFNGNNRNQQRSLLEEEMKREALGLIGVGEYLFSFVNEQDPFNTQNSLNVVVCKKDGPFYGSMVISSVNNVSVPQVIYGTPKMETAPKSFPEGLHSSFYLANKWNGENVMFFKYFDSDGNVFVSARPRAFPFLRDSRFVTHLSLVKRIINVKHIDLKNLPPLLSGLSNKKMQSITFELCGKDVLQLVSYKFPTLLQPLFTSDMDGNISPIFSDANLESDLQELKELTNNVGPLPFDSAQLLLLLDDFRKKALTMNQNYRTQENRVEGYDYSNFLIEGKVLYCLDEGKRLTHREAIYKIKPSDIETSHRVVFDYAMQYRSLEALSKLYSKGDKYNEENMRKELDLSQGAWLQFGQEIMSLTQGVPNLYNNLPISNQKILIMVGVPGSGKSTVANQLVSLDNRWYRVNQDEMKSRPACEKYARDALKKGYSLIVDRCNFDIKQRSTWIKIANEFNINDIRCLNFMIPFEVCKSRISLREDHPTIPSGDSGHAIIDSFAQILVPPIRLEGLSEVLLIKDDADIAAALQSLSTLHHPPESIPQ